MLIVWLAVYHPLKGFQIPFSANQLLLLALLGLCLQVNKELIPEANGVAESLFKNCT
jgi:hypothetical protein